MPSSHTQVLIIFSELPQKCYPKVKKTCSYMTLASKTILVLKMPDRSAVLLQSFTVLCYKLDHLNDLIKNNP